MPVYEKKLISPLAIRFTQEHIRTTFQNGRIVGEALEEIHFAPARDDSSYDLVLNAPFPAIEIVRWRAPESVAKQDRVGDLSEHWFTLDNRRLYCLQRAAMQKWPLRVAAEVDILYADHGRALRKYDSTTVGQSVSIGLSCKGPELAFWDWLISAQTSTSIFDVYAAAALQTAELDDQKTNIDALTNAEDDSNAVLSSALLRLLECEGMKVDGYRAGTPSTSQADSQDFPQNGVTERSSEGDTTDAENVEWDPLVGTERLLTSGVWQCEKGNSYTIRCSGKGKGHWTCWRQGTEGNSKSFSLFYDDERASIWWGTKGLYFACVSELQETSARLRWYGIKDEQMRKPKFCWTLQAAVAASTTVRLAEQALSEISHSLQHQESLQGYVWIDGWNKRYGRRGLGQLRAFLERHPDKFHVTPTCGNAFSVALVDKTGPKQLVNRTQPVHSKKGS